MSGIIVFSGTSEGRQLSEALERGKIAHLVCVATRIGAEVMEHGTYAKVHEGRLDAEHMRELVQEQKAESRLLPGPAACSALLPIPL